jgi:hypothetical protein
METQLFACMPAPASQSVAPLQPSCWLVARHCHSRVCSSPVLVVCSLNLEVAREADYKINVYDMNEWRRSLAVEAALDDIMLSTMYSAIASPEPMPTAPRQAHPNNHLHAVTSAVAITAGVMVLSSKQSASLPSKTCSNHSLLLVSGHLQTDIMHRCIRMSYCFSSEDA